MFEDDWRERVRFWAAFVAGSVALVLVMSVLGDVRRQYEPAPAPAPVGPRTPPDPARVPGELLAAHNAERARHGLAPYRFDPRLVRAAQAHADFMARRRSLNHTSIGDGDPFTRMKAAGYEPSTGSENIGAGQDDVREIMAGWLHSPGHRAAVLGRFKDYGGAVALDADGTEYWCSVFGVEGGSR